jgi:hypothetical protein
VGLSWQVLTWAKEHKLNKNYKGEEIFNNNPCAGMSAEQEDEYRKHVSQPVWFDAIGQAIDNSRMTVELVVQAIQRVLINCMVSSFRKNASDFLQTFNKYANTTFQNLVEIGFEKRFKDFFVMALFKC